MIQFHTRLSSITIALTLMLSAVAVAAHAASNRYEQHNLVSDGAPANHVDKNLVNAWGIVFNPNGFVWVADNGTGVSTLYDGKGNPQSLVVRIPVAQGSSGSGKPTGIVFNGTNDFVVS